jgi:hypothetical protein
MDVIFTLAMVFGGLICAFRVSEYHQTPTPKE